MSASGGRWLLILVGLGLSVALLGLMEWASGVYLRHRLANAPRSMIRVDEDFLARNLRALDTNPVPLVSDPVLMWRNQPLAEKTQPVNPRHFGRPEKWTLRNNSEGFRGPERPFKDQNDDYRILLVGDSITFGVKVEQDATFARRVEAALHAQYPTRRFEAVNAGVVGWTWAQGLRFVERYGLGLHPDLIVIAHGSNDQFWVTGITDREKMWLLQSPIAWRLQQLSDWLWQTNMYRALLSFEPPPPKRPAWSPACELQVRRSGKCRRVSLEEIEYAIDHLHQLTKAAGVDLLVMNVDFIETPAVHASRAATRRDGVPFLDEVSHFRSLRIADDRRLSRNLGLEPAHVPQGVARVMVDNETLQPRGPRVLFRVVFGRTPAVVSVRGVGDNFQFNEHMYDDGTHGDEKADDGVYSAFVATPPGTSVLKYQFWEDDRPEFQTLPGNPVRDPERMLRFSDDSIAFVERFGDLFLMAEAIHPDARGHEVIADDIVASLPHFASFMRFVHDPAAHQSNATR